MNGTHIKKSKDINHIPKQQRGFSLVELSIVLVILGLLVGGVLGGRSLVKAAELRAITTEHQEWLIAVNAFRQKYNSLPGDTDIATRLWSGTWNGNNDGKLDYAPSSGQHGENLAFWQHLALAGLIPGTYTGVAGPGSEEDSIAGVNVPGSKYSGGGWTAEQFEWETSLGNVGWYNISYGNFFHLGAKSPDWEYGDGLLTPEEAWNIDSKMDDGIPSRGKVIARHWDDCATAVSGATSATNLNAQYALSTTTTECALAFLGM